MLCDNCQETDAVVHLTRIINGEKEEIHLCEDCAKKSNKFNLDSFDNISFQSMLSAVLNDNKSSDNSFMHNKLNNNKKCNSCALNYHEFTKSGEFGCADCYLEFEDDLETLFKRIHGNKRHTGKRPANIEEKKEYQEEINRLKAEMESAVEEERFEDAAEIRDKIHEIKKSMKEDIDESKNI
ncbi:UvrB/UvrC motif-containing protein [Halanaerobium hydrogeniformans]|uniref:UvrB/UvrC protein n=1 Tax=Halanaerobium hydrogeniformans TaxID=656519 RepID=E4RJE9_HALHG|nr:UvrB/UvrC motif-containing protein [Halanaerobium hydrogeniformans]ADQ15369.1 UvrB/UvrC protein [Halanaerobium hydrogeniformans]